MGSLSPVPCLQKIVTDERQGVGIFTGGTWGVMVREDEGTASLHILMILVSETETDVCFCASFQLL